MKWKAEKHILKYKLKCAITIIIIGIILKGDPDYVKDSRFDWWTKYRLATFEGTSIDIQEPEQQYVDENHDRLKVRNLLKKR